MTIPVIENAMNTVKKWVDFGPTIEPEQPVNRFSHEPRKSFDERFPKVRDCIKLEDGQRLNLMSQLGLSQVGKNELDLGLSRCPSDTEFTAVAGLVSSVIRAWRDQVTPGGDSDALASRKLLESSQALAKIDGALQAARLAAEQAQAAEREFDSLFIEFRSLPGRYKAVSDKIASLEFERQRLTSTDWDAKIRELISFELSPRPGLIVAESIPNLLLQRDTLKLRLDVIDDLLSQCRPALDALADDNRRLARELDLQEHKL